MKRILAERVWSRLDIERVLHSGDAAGESRLDASGRGVLTGFLEALESRLAGVLRRGRGGGGEGVGLSQLSRNLPGVTGESRLDTGGGERGESLPVTDDRREPFR